MTSRNVGDSPLKKNISQSENEAILKLIELIVTKDFPPISNLTSYLSSLPPDVHTFIGSGKKSLLTFLNKHSDIFLVQDDKLNIRPSIISKLSINVPPKAANTLKNTVCVVKGLFQGFGFLADPDGEEVYFGANVFEEGKTQQLPGLLKRGDSVIVDAVKTKMGFKSKWDATRVRRVSGGTVSRSRSSSSCQSWRGSTASLNSDWERNLDWSRKSPLDFRSMKVMLAANCKTKEDGTKSISLAPWEKKIVTFFIEQVRRKQGIIPLVNLTGHVSKLSAEESSRIGRRSEDVKKFLTKHKDYFILTNDVVTLTGCSLSAEEKDELKFVRCEALDENNVRLPGGQGASITTAIATEKLVHGDIVTCNVTTKSSRPKVVKVHAVDRVPRTNVETTTKTLSPSSSASLILNYIGKIISLHATFGFIGHGKTEDENIFFSKDCIQNYFFSSLHEGDTVRCDAQRVTDIARCKYRALSVTPLKDSASLSNLEAFDEKGNDSTSTKAEDDDGELNELYNCTSPIVQLTPNFGFLRYGLSVVYFHSSCFYLDNAYRVLDLTKHLKIDDLVNYDAIPSKNPADSAKWRATYSWIIKEVPKKDKETICREGRILTTTKKTGIIAFGSNAYKDRVSFSADVFFVDGMKVTTLKKQFKSKQVVTFKAETDFESTKTKWKATCVWTGLEPSFCKSNSDGDIIFGRGEIFKLLPGSGAIKWAGTDEIRFDVQDFYDNGILVENLEWSLKLGEIVNFDASRNESDVKSNKWTALLVWKGTRPVKIKTTIDKKAAVQKCLEQFNPLSNFTVDEGKVPVVSISNSGSVVELKEIDETNDDSLNVQRGVFIADDVDLPRAIGAVPESLRVSLTDFLTSPSKSDDPFPREDSICDNFAGISSLDPIEPLSEGIGENFIYKPEKFAKEITASPFYNLLDEPFELLEEKAALENNDENKRLMNMLFPSCSATNDELKNKKSLSNSLSSTVVDSLLSDKQDEAHSTVEECDFVTGGEWKFIPLQNKSNYSVPETSKPNANGFGVLNEYAVGHNYNAHAFLNDTWNSDEDEKVENLMPVENLREIWTSCFRELQELRRVTLEMATSVGPKKIKAPSFIKKENVVYVDAAVQTIITGDISGRGIFPQ